jgi:purine-nucleoside phosphorylase
MRVLGISTVTNLAVGISPTPLSHEEVLEAGRVVAADLERLVRGILRRL